MAVAKRKPSEGDLAPDFKLPGSDGKTHSLSDPTKRVAKSYGVLRAMGLFAARHTFYVGVVGKILFVDTRVKTATAGDDLVERLRTLEVKQL